MRAHHPPAASGRSRRCLRDRRCNEPHIDPAAWLGSESGWDGAMREVSLSPPPARRRNRRHRRRRPGRDPVVAHGPVVTDLIRSDLCDTQLVRLGQGGAGHGGAEPLLVAVPSQPRRTTRRSLSSGAVRAQSTSAAVSTSRPSLRPNRWQRCRAVFPVPAPTRAPTLTRVWPQCSSEVSWPLSALMIASIHYRGAAEVAVALSPSTVAIGVRCVIATPRNTSPRSSGCHEGPAIFIRQGSVTFRHLR